MCEKRMQGAWDEISQKAPLEQFDARIRQGVRESSSEGRRQPVLQTSNLTSS